MTLEEKCRLSYYKKIAEISMHKNVCLVQHVETNRVFVRKEQTIDCLEVFENLKNCNNPHIPKIFECIEDEDTLIIIEEYIQGESLADHLEEKGVYSQEEVCSIVITICDVLEELHQLQQPVFHGDLKPENILIQENGTLKIIDFNTAKHYETGNDFDTVGYRQLDARTDIYALGVMMNYLLTKKYPDKYLFVSERNGKISLLHIIGKCVDFSPEKRYQTVTDLRRDLQALSEKKRKRDKIHIINFQNNVSEKKGMWNFPYFPPGFRTGEVWKMLVGLMGYLFIFWCICTTDFFNSDGGAMTGFYLWANRLTFLLWCLITVAFYTNYLGLQKHLPLMQGKYLRWVGYLLWPIFFLFLLIFILVMIGG